MDNVIHLNREKLRRDTEQYRAFLNELNKAWVDIMMAHSGVSDEECLDALLDIYSDYALTSDDIDEVRRRTALAAQRIRQIPILWQKMNEPEE